MGAGTVVVLFFDVPAFPTFAARRPFALELDPAPRTFVSLVAVRSL